MRDKSDWYQSNWYAEKSQRRYEQKRQWNKESRATGEICGKCGKRFADDEQRYRVSEYNTPFVVMCSDCAPEWLSSRRGKPQRIIPSVDVHEWNCAGCGRAVVFGMSGRQNRERVYCSDRCREEAARKREARATEPHAKTCGVCGTEFVAKRADARTCSPACRQKAYRQRLQGVAWSPME